MMDALPRPYPGTNAAPAEIFALATEYHTAAEALLGKARAQQRISHAPARLCAVHAIELYLNAFLLATGDPPERVRARFHDLAERAEAVTGRGLILRKLTIRHLVRMTEDREYLISRYGPEMSGTLSQSNRLMATLNEIATKVRARISPV
ncbi:hypothetical protein [uncultured Paracoccus sp.]|uniref:hypothetical protein n=1 Tax=uncultured Paracoccus sp. TaxID=189685 RepID=UPI0026061F56|nr:hypothetical protein [uncultured Paracoccus sp.]